MQLSHNYWCLFSLSIHQKQCLVFCTTLSKWDRLLEPIWHSHITLEQQMDHELYKGYDAKLWLAVTEILC